MPIYNKLVRDRILEIIEQDGKTFTSHILSPAEHAREIKTKLTEEVDEYLHSTNNQEAVEELADILELIHAALPLHGVTFDDLERVRVNKKQKRGGFEKGIYLGEVEDD